ncbi:ATP-binding protein [Undibacterium flavidum]|uniref:histidine kinase n=1 Tax=Undibacterium flavidum TaxID=2762297 RepID=A0ABR6YB78_9BURK|nr:ATP-binding protein [Undibacterium flavidum]MBC3873816.1 GAF domain-containing protein [Undibacterium flavidum]
MLTWNIVTGREKACYNLSFLRILLLVFLLAFSPVFSLASPKLLAQAITNDNTSPRPILGAPVISNYDAKVYKEHTQNWSAVQDQRGVIYVGNSSGLLEFDGQRWQAIDTKSKPMIRALAIAADQTIYYGSIGDFGYLSVNQNGKVRANSLRDLIPPNALGFNDVWQIETTSHGVYFLTRSHIFRFHQGKVTEIGGKFASSQALVMNDHVFYIDSQRGLSLIDDGQIIPLPEFANVADGKRIVLARFAPHQILAGRASGDFLTLDLSSLWDPNSKKYRPNHLPASFVRSLPTEIDQLTKHDNLFIYKMIQIDEQSFAISTVKGGIIILNRQGKVLRVINRHAGLIDNTVTGLMLDRSHNLWATTNSGISHIELSVPQSVFNANNGIEGISIASYYYQGQFYVGTYQHILKQLPHQYSPEQDVPQFAPLPNSPGEIWQFKEVAGDLMIASGRGLFKVTDNGTQRIDGSSSDAYALGVSQRWPNHLFMGKMGGLEVFQRDQGQWKLLGKLKEIQDNIRRIATDASGDLWLTTEVQGLIRIHFNGDDPLQIKLHKIGLEHGLPELTSIRASFLNGTLFLASQKGIYSAQIATWNDDSESSKFSPDKRFGSQFSDGSLVVTDISLYANGIYLLQTSDGVQWVERDQTGQFRANSKPFLGLSNIGEALYVHPDSSVWLPGENHYRIDPNSNKNYAEQFSALVRKVAANTKDIIFEGNYGVDGREIPREKTVFQTQQTADQTRQLSYQQNALMFEFAATFFEKPGSTRYQYQLEGFDRQWSEWDSISSKEYTNIPEGQYRFRVRAKNIYGTLANEAEYRFTILPPWYRTLWAYTLWIILGITSIVGLVYLYTLRLRTNKKLLEKEVLARTREAVEQREAADKARHNIAQLAEMGRQITASLDSHAIEENLKSYVKDLLPWDNFGIGLVDWERRLIRFDYVIENDQAVRPYQRSLDSKEQPASHCVLQAKDLLINDLTLDTRELDSFVSIEPEHHHHQVIDDKPRVPRSAIYVPMMLKQKIIGVIFIQNNAINSYHENDVAILRSLAAYAAVAFDNAIAYHRLQLTQSKLVEQEKLAALGALVAGVAHELNTPIGNSLLTASSLDEITTQLVHDINAGSIRRSRIDNFAEHAKNACALLVRNLNNAATLITNFKQISVDQTSDKRRIFNLLTVTTEIASTLGGRIRRDEHHLSINIPDNIELDSYPGPYGQVITNMIINALIHAFDDMKNREIRIIGKKLNDTQIKLVISDNGHGISEDNLNRIFEPFFTTRMGQGGSGLGLHISYNIVTAILGGSIQVKSRIGRGTYFEIILPLVAPETTPEDIAGSL